MGRNKYTPEQALEVFRAKFAAQYPGCKAIIQAVDEQTPMPIVVDATKHTTIYEFVDSLINNKITSENVEQILRWMDNTRNEICDQCNVYDDADAYKKRKTLFESDKKYKLVYHVMDKVTYKPTDMPAPTQIGTIGGNRINADGSITIGQSSAYSSIGDGSSVCIGYTLPKKVEAPAQPEQPKRFYIHQNAATTGHWEVDRNVYGLLTACDQLYDTNIRPVTTAAEVHMAVSNVNNALSYVASNARKLAETAERLSGHK